MCDCFSIRRVPIGVLFDQTGVLFELPFNLLIHFNSVPSSLDYIYSHQTTLRKSSNENHKKDEINSTLQISENFNINFVGLPNVK